MEENPEKIMKFLDSYDEKSVKDALNLLESKPGYPIVNLRNIRDNVILGLMSNNILQTPAITASGGKVNFLFTPYINTTDKEMVKHARNVVSAVRYGEKFSQYSELQYPDLFLQRLIERGYIGKTPHSDIEAQYGVLRDNGLGWIEEVGDGRYRFHLADTSYAKDVVKLARTMISAKHSFDPEVQRGIIAEAWEEREYLSNYKFSEYIPNLSNLKHVKKNLKERLALLNQIQLKIRLTKLLINCLLVEANRMYFDDKDFFQKCRFQKILWAMGYWSRIEIPIVIYEDDNQNRKLQRHYLTDIDVYGEIIQSDF